LGIEVVTISTTTPSVDPLATTKHYIVDMSTSTGDITLNLPALAAGSVIELSIINNKTNGYRATLHAAGSDTIAYDDVTTYTDAKVVYPNVWLRLVSRTTYWVIEDCSMPLTGTFSGPITFTGAITASAGIVGKTDGIAIAAGYVGQSVNDATANGVDLSSTTEFVDVHSYSLGAGAWLVFGGFGMDNAGSNTGCEIVLSLYSANTTTDHSAGYNWTRNIVTANSSGYFQISGFVVNTTGQTVYLKGKAIGATTTVGRAQIWAVRIA
jgi:hypothetical protein